MRTHYATAAAVLALLGGQAATALGESWPDPRKMKVPTLHEITAPKPERVEMENGMVVLFLEDHEFPVVDVRAMIRVGSIYEPADKVGLADITGEVMRTGGSTKTDGDALDEKLESMGASVETWIEDTDGGAFVSTLSEDVEEGLGILSEILRTPAFPDEKIELAKKQQRTAIASRNDELFDILSRELPKLVYGAGHPYARHTEYATIDAITRDDLVAFHKEYYHPNRIIMTVYGDFKTADVKALLTRTFGDWKPSTKPLPPDPPVTPSQVDGLFLADKEGLTQTAIVIGHEGIRNDHPDYAAMMVYHEAMGGGLTGRLFNEIRSKRGLAYATGSSSGTGLHHPGGQLYYAVTQADSTVETLAYLRAEVQKSLSAPFTDVEIQKAKDAILNSLVFTLSSKGAVLNRMASYEYYGYPMNFLETYQEGVKKMTAEEVLAAAKRNIRYPKMATLLVGTKETFSGSLAALGAYTELDITIPEPAGDEIPEATAADFARGQDLLAAAAKAANISAIASVKDMTEAFSGSLSIQGMDLSISGTFFRRFPDCFRAEMTLPMGKMVQALCGDEGWMDMMQGPQPLPASELEKAKKERQRDLVQVLRGYADLEAQALPAQADVEGKPAEVVFVHSDDIKGWKIYLDPTTHLVVRMDYRDTDPMGSPVLASEVLKDYKSVSGFKYPHQQTTLHDGKPFLDLTFQSVTLDAGVDAGVFKMPSE